MNSVVAPGPSELIVPATLMWDMIYRLPTDPTVETYSGRPEVYCDDVISAPGGKSRNIAVMAAHLGVAVSVLARTGGPYTQEILAGLKEAGVKADSVMVNEDRSPGLADISIILQGDRTPTPSTYSMLPEVAYNVGESKNFNPADIDASVAEIARSSVVAFALDIPLDTASHALYIANKLGKRTIVDLGGVSYGNDDSVHAVRELIKTGQPYLVKPNQQEAEFLTGISIDTPGLALFAARQLVGLGAKNVLLSLGRRGAVLANNSGQQLVYVPRELKGKALSPIGAGDQMLAAVITALLRKRSLLDAVKLGVRAGSLQAKKPGVRPLGSSELMI